MGKASRAKRERAAVSVQTTSPRRLPLPWIAASVIVVVAGVLVIALSRSSEADVAPLVGDHWHAAIGFNVCGTWAPDVPEFENPPGQSTRTGIHSHGDGLMHMHPFTSGEAGNNATVGLWMENGGQSVDADGFSLWTGESYTTGSLCPDGQAGSLVWSVNGEPQTGNPADYKPDDLDVIAIGFLPEGVELGSPPSAASVGAPVDVAAPAQATEVPTETTDQTASVTADGEQP